MARLAPKVAVVTPDKARAASLPSGFVRPKAAGARANAYLDGENNPLHLHLHCIAPGEALQIGPLASDCVVYVWQGDVAAGGVAMAAGSSAIVEHGEALEVLGGSAEAQVLTFAAASADKQARAGGHVHLLPRERVPRLDSLSGAGGAGGALHADSGCPTCEVWLHENFFPAGLEYSPEDAEKGIHSHSEDEIIFVTKGSIRLGAKLFPAGTALAIAAETLYSFTVGPEGMSFVNFRAGTPGDIKFANGMAISETGYWQDKVPRPEYLSPVAG